MSDTEANLQRLADLTRHYQDGARDAQGWRDAAIREAIRKGMSAYKVAQITGLDERGIGRIRDKGL